MQDLRYSFRLMRRSPVFTGVALVLMALGIGANTAVFSVVSEVLLRSLPVSHPEELVELETDDTANHVAGSEFSYPAFELFSASNALTSGMFARSEPVQVDVMDGGVSGLAHAVFDSWSAPSVLGLQPALGRLSNSGDAQDSAQTPPVFLSYGYWQKRFGGASSVIGKTVAIDTIPFVIAGVYAANFRGIAVGIEPEIVLPVYMVDRIRGIPTLHNPNSWGFTILCRRKPGVTLEQLRAGLTPPFEAALANFVAHEPPGMGGDFRRYASHLRFRAGSASLGASSGTRSQLRSPLTILMVITALVFLLTCANLAGLILSKTEGRMSEIGIRLAIGCSRARLLRQLITENFLICAAGGIAGLLAAYWTGPLLARLLASGQSSDALNAHPDLLMLAYGVALTLVGSLLPGAVPAWRAMRLDPLFSIRRSTVASSVRNFRPAGVLVVCQIAASLVLALVAGQFIRSLLNYQGLDAGFRPDHLITVSVRPDLVKYNPQRRIAYERQMYARLSQIPGVRALTFSADAFGKSTWNTLVHVPGYTPKGTLDDTLQRNLAGPRFVETLGLQLLAGRDFDQRDNEQAPPTVIVNESFARHFFGTEDVLGKQIFFIDSPRRADTIVGVVRDARDRGLRQPTKPAVYSNYEHDALGWMTFTVRVERPAPPMLKEVVSVFRRFDPQVPIERTGTAEAAINEGLARERALADLSSLIGLLATGIAMVGLYGTLAYAVVRRTREIGIRMALGARQSHIQWLAIRNGGLLLLAGIALGMPVYAAVARLLRDLVFGVQPGDPIAAFGVLALLAISAGMATYIPSWRAARVDPARALKCD